MLNRDNPKLIKALQNVIKSLTFWATEVFCDVLLLQCISIDNGSLKYNYFRNIY